MTVQIKAKILMKRGPFYTPFTADLLFTNPNKLLRATAMFHRSVLTTAVILIAAALLVGITPAAWIEQARASAARRLLELGREAPKQVAVRCGFANADTLRRAFVRHIGVSPAEYRKRYAND